MTDAALDFLLEKMMQFLNNSNDELILKAHWDKHTIEWLYEELQSLRKFLKDSEEKRDQYEELKSIAADIRGVTYRVDDIIDSFLLQIVIQTQRDDIADADWTRMVIELEDTLLISSDYITNNFPYPNNVQIWKCLHFLTNNWHLVFPACLLIGLIYLSFITATKYFFPSSPIEFPKDSQVLMVMGPVFLFFCSVIVFFDHFRWYFIITPIKVLTRKWRDFLYLKYLCDVTEEIKLIKTQVMEIYEKKMYGIGIGIGIGNDIIGVQQIGKPSNGASSKPVSPTLEEETIVGLDDEARTIMELLTEEHGKQLKLVSILGMPGLGKTTLARKVYDDPLIKYHFHILSWTCVSQDYRKRDLLLSIFRSAFQPRYEISQIHNLGEELYRRLKGRRYLIVLDDIWDEEAWVDLKRYFPNDNNGSRVLLTSRHEGVATALQAKLHHLRFLDENESWDLLRLKTFREDNCPPELMETGKQIAKKCQGLPLAIVLMSRLLAKKDETHEWWEHVATSVSSHIVSDRDKYIDTLALSYNHLPHHLKPCFLYFGAFPEDFEIPVCQLIWLWVAEGFIRGQNDHKSLEEVAEDYLMDLIDRSLVLVSKKRSDGGIKMCHVHDLLRDLCLKKAQEENFLQHISRYKHNSSSSSSSNPFAYKPRRICVHDYLVDFTSLKHNELHIRSLFSFCRSFHLPWKDVVFVCKAFKLLRVLNLLYIKIRFIPMIIEQLVHLRCLALHVEPEPAPAPLIPYVEPPEPEEILLVSNLQNLETLIVDGPEGSLFLNDVWKMVKLRHVHTRTWLIKIGYPLDDACPSILDNLQTIGKLSIVDKRDELILKRSPNLKKLKCQCQLFPPLEFLIHLEKLNLVYGGNKRFSHLGKLPTNLKSLTLSKFGLPWKAMSTLGSLPNLKVLKLSYKAFEGPRWDTIDGEFHRLRFLKLQGLDIEHWNVSGSHFPNLQTLVLDDCERLEEIPSSLGDISTLEMIQVRWCSCSVENSAKQIQEQQRNLGNDGLRVLIYSLNHN